MRFSVSLSVGCLVALTVVTVGANSASAQLSRGGEMKLEAAVTGEERGRQPNHWTCEIHMKPLRLISVDLTNSATGEKKPEFVWYIAYRIYNRSYVRLGEGFRPENRLDEPQLPPLFAPEITLVAKSTGGVQTYRDVICPEAVAAINKREKGNYKSGLDVIGPIPAASNPEDADQQSIEGVAVFRGVDTSATRYTIFMSGFSNGFEVVPGNAQKPTVRMKTVQIEYWRPGDRFDVNEPEIRLDSKPVWMYR